MRVYLPLTWPDVQALATAGLPAPLSGHAVTAGLRADHADADEEQLEFWAGAAAASASAERIRAEAALPRRAVLAVDLPDSAVTDHGQRAGAPTAVTVTMTITLAETASVQVDEPDADIDLPADQLLWYDVTEIVDLAHSSA
jgi:hypothetical protein